VFGSIRGGGGIRPGGGGRSDLLLKVGPPNVAARLSIGEIGDIGDIGDVGDVGDVGDIGSATVIANVGELGTRYHTLVLLTRRRCCSADMIG
jgi:hypothetical protein